MPVEGEFDALAVEQCARDIIATVGTGSTSGARREAWVQRLEHCPLVLVSFDSDEARERAARFWTEALSNGRRWRPEGHDPNDMLRAGFDVRAWGLAGLATGRPKITNEGSPVVARPVRDEHVPHGGADR